jgi:hypothetical protein
MESSPSFRVRVTKGCRDLGITKGATATFRLDAYPGIGVEAGRVRGSASLWLSGNRSRVPTVAVGQSLSLNTGRPEHRVVVEVTAILP